MGYRDDDCALYIFLMTTLMRYWMSPMTSAARSSQDADEEFKAMIQNDNDLAHLSSKMVFVWEENYRLTSGGILISTVRWIRIGTSLLTILLWIKEIPPQSF